MATLTIHHYLDIIKSFINDVETSRNSYYLFFGKPDPWLNSSGGNDDVNVTTNHVANDSVYQHESSIYHDMIFGKVITPPDIEYMIPRYDWTANTVYDQYDQFTMDVFNDKFYVVTDEFNVFKVIDNNNYAASTIKPTLTSASGTFQTSDGYIWKFMYNIGSAANLAFTTANFIPVTPNTSVSANSTNGTIDAIRITNGGNGYPYYTGYLSSSIDNKTLIIDNGASYTNGYYTKSSIYLKDGYGAGQIRQIQKYDGLNKIVTVDAPFDNYGVFNISEINNPASFVVGNILTQNIDSIATVYNKGIFRVNDVLIQSDTGANGQIVIANSTIIKVIKGQGSNAFSLNFPIYNTSQSSNLTSGKITVTPFIELNVASNTGAFTVGEWLYQANSTANTANGIVANVIYTQVTDLAIASNTGAFTAGEWIYQSNGTANTANGIVYSVNSSVIKVTNVSGTFVSNSTANNVRGNTSSSNALVTTITSNNFVNLRVGIPTGTFVINSTANSVKGNTSGSNATIKNISSNNAGNNYIYSTNTAQTSFTTQFLVGDYLRVGENANLNIRKVTAVNSSVITTDEAINTSIAIVSANLYNVPSVLEPSSVTLTKAHGVISNVNIYGVKITYSDKTNLAINYIPGEKVNLVDSSNTTQGVYGIVSYSNTSTVILTGVTGGNGFQSILGGTKYTDLTISSNTGVFNVGEWVYQSNGTANTANGIVSSVNTSVIRVGTVGGVFVANYSTQQIHGNTSGANAVVTYVNSNTVGGSNAYVRGESSLQRGKIVIVDSYPNVTVYDPAGEFLTGIQVNTRDPANGGVLGYANVISFYTTPNQLTEYSISPTVTITGDGANALAYSLVDTSNTSTGALTNIIVLNPGHNYTYANIAIVSNNFFSSGANVQGVVSPVDGHGSDVYSELGAKYAGISMTVANGMSEGYKFPVYGSYRRIGIIKNPLFNNVTVNLDSFDRVRLSINSLSVNTFATNEYVLQANSGAVGQVVYANSSHIELKAVKGTFSANLKFANGSSANDNVRGLTSNSLANVATSNVIYFTIASSVETISELTTGANAVISSPLSNTQLLLNSVGGRFVTGDTVYDPITNAYANVVSIYVSNGTIDVSSIFADNFDQTLRFPLTTNSAPYQQFERVTQEFSNATGMVISNNNEQDIIYTGANGSFSVGNIVRNSVNTATGILTYANNTYLRLTSVNGYFVAGQTIINNLDIGATISGAYYTLVLSDIGGSGLFSTGPNSGNVTGLTTGSTGRSNIINPDSSPAKNVIKYPDLVLNSGEVSYLENISSIFQLSNTSKETVKIVIKF